MVLFRRRSRYRSRYDRKSRRLHWIPMLLLILGIPIGLELCARLIFNTTGLTAQLEPEQVPAIVQAYQLQFVSPDGQPYESLPSEGTLAAARDPLLGYQLLTGQKSDFWTINAQGFRDPDPVPVDKPNGEIRLVILGGSTAFGQLSTSDQTGVTEQLEARLNQKIEDQQTKPGEFQPSVLPYRADQVDAALALPPQIKSGQYRVINAAVPGYASGNELSLLMQHVAAYDPDVLIVLDGYADLMLPSDRGGVDIPKLDAALNPQPESISSRLSGSIVDGFNQLYLVRIIKRYLVPKRVSDKVIVEPLNWAGAAHSPDLNAALAVDDAEIDQRVARYQHHLVQMVRWTSGVRKRIIIAVQPEITGRTEEARTPEESSMIQALGQPYADQIPKGYAKLASAATAAAQLSENATAIDLYQLYETFEGQAFQSPIELTDDANRRLAERLYSAVEAELAIQPLPFGSTP
ncbi:MAG: SGNH/GDSL hydrolase family protein [Cyanobacteria bacterium J06639_16]